MKVSEVMTAQVVTGTPRTTGVEAAQLMAKVDTGALPIVDGGKVVGLVTDRDIVLRLVAKGGDLQSPISEIMSDHIQSCLADDNVADAAATMGAHQVRRLIVYNGDGGVAGIVSLGDIAVDYGAKAVGQTLEEISEPANS